jgi:hypothetical protein
LTIPHQRERLTAHLHIGCFGNFRIEDRVCRRHCAIRIRCVIERDQAALMDVIDETEPGNEAYFVKFR